jgi:hypothetical protein
MNKGEIDKINKTNFEANITLIKSARNTVGIDCFKGYYQNYLTEFLDITFTLINFFRPVIKCLNIGNLKKLIRAIFLESLLLAKK